MIRVAHLIRRAPVLITGAALLLAAVPASAQVDLSGEWDEQRFEDGPERGGGPDLVDYSGIPISDAAQQRGLAHDASLLAVPEYQCRPHPADYANRHSEFRMWRTIDLETQALVAYHTHKRWQAQERTIWMDGRPHPPEFAPHTWQGFSTGEWVSPNMLKVTTTHLKTSYLRRNGLPRSDAATLTEYFIRRGDRLSWISIVDDPVYLTEPFVRTSDYIIDPTQVIAAYPCAYVTEIDRPRTSVPHYLPGENPFLTEYAEKHGLPLEAVLGGAETALPEYQQLLSTIE